VGEHFIPGLKCSLRKDGWYIGGQITSGIALAIATGGTSAAAEGAEAAGNVLLDTNAVFKYSQTVKLLGDGETPVVSDTVLREIAEVSSRAGSRFNAELPEGIGRIADDLSIGGRMRAMEALRQFGAAEQGIEGDASVISTALANKIPLITGDKAVFNAISKLGGSARLLKG
jgi:rRNA-processing protein FCF1